MKENRLLKALKDDRGYVFIEASIVYPIMFFIIVFLIYMGNMFLLRARIDSAVASEAIRYANYFSNPYVKELKKNDYAVSNTAKDTTLTDDLYRYLYKQGSYADETDLTKLKERISDIGLFNNISPSNISITEGVNNYVFYQTYTVQATYELKFPIKFIFMDENWVLKMSAREEAPVTDQSEFIRNIDMAVDYIERTEGGNQAIEQFSRLKSKFDEFLNNFGGN